MPHYSQKPRGHRLCDQCGAVENPAIAKFRLCGGCLVTQYCSPACQKIHWPVHKTVCHHTSSQLSSAKQVYGESDVARNLRKFTSAYNTLLGWVGFQALQLKRIPSNIRSNALLIELTPRSSSDASRRFSIAATHIIPRTYINDPVVIADIQRREERCRHGGGIGTLVIVIQCGSVSQVMPVEVDAPSRITWDMRDDWLSTLHHCVESGQTEFLPKSTTSRG
ncbi:hypothetical protein CPB85DRAFT_1376996 [Mucidula mucida]|nr:hypothetical protein CPB85DRAFT_1376996 [Mucidula mucida]